MKKSLTFGLLFIMITFLGCGQPVQDPNTLVVWHWMVDRHDAFKVLAEKYKSETGINVIFRLYAPSDIYSKKIVASAQARILPDIYGVLDVKSGMADFIKSGFVADLTSEFKKDRGAWEKSFFPKALATNVFEKKNSYGVEPGIYGVPLDVMNIQMLYNKNLLRKAGFDRPPKTFDEFLAVIDTLKRLGIPALVSGWGELWMLDCFASNYAFNIMGEKKVMETYRGKVPYTDPDWIKVFKLFDTLAKRSGLMVGVVTKTNKYAEQDFALERAAFAFNGSWCINVYHKMNPNLEYGAMLPPAFGQKYPMKIWGGAGSSFVINNFSSNKEKAIQFLKWLSSKDQQVYLSKETRNLPSNREALYSIPDILSEFASGMDDTTHPTIWPLDEDSQVKEKFDKGLQSLIIGEKTPEQVAIEVQKVKDRRMKNKKKYN